MRQPETIDPDFDHWYDEEQHGDHISPEQYIRALVDEMDVSSGGYLVVNGRVLFIHSINTRLSAFDRDSMTVEGADGRFGMPVAHLYGQWKAGEVRAAERSERFSPTTIGLP